ATRGQNGTERRRVLGVVGVVVAAVIIFSGWMKFRSAVVSVRAEKVVRADITSVISTNGKIEPVRNFEAHAPAPATVKKVFANEGDHVRAGQLLVQLDDADAREKAARALAELRAAEANLHAIQSGGTQEEILTIRTDLTKAQTERDDAQRNL